MKWETKARIQNLVSLLPSRLSYSVYYGIQRRFGRLRQFEFPRKIRAAVEIWKHIEAQGRNPEGGVFFEVGTGWVPMVPLTFWLMGASRTVTVDLNPYVRPELMKEGLAFMREHPNRVKSILGDNFKEERYRQVIDLASSGDYSLEALLDLGCIDYKAPSDAAATGLDDSTIDYHVSFVVLEHIPPAVIQGILKEGNRIVKPGGLFAHLIDYSDHFSHTDKSITAINFLQYSDEEWSRIAENRYMYMNRLRHDDYLEMFREAGHRLLEVAPVVDSRAEELLASGTFRIDERFASKPREILAIKNSWFVSEMA